MRQRIHMTPFAPRITALVRAFLLCTALVLTARAAEPPIIAKARAFIAPEPTLNALTSVRYVGTLVTKDPSDPTKQTRASMEIIFQKPYQQRITATTGQTVEVTALDDYEAWQRVHEISDSSKWRQTLMQPEQVKRLRANTWENLSFFRGIEQVGGRLEDHGAVTVDGIACQRLAFIHSPTIIFYRTFEIATGRLVLTETEAGGTIRERGEMRVQGMRFPRSIVTATKNAKGELQEVTIEFESVYVNERFPPSYFGVPLPMAR
jgi:outer membrane lipoprotein-sorting protein